jgi:hypothetical protein
MAFTTDANGEFRTAGVSAGADYVLRIEGDARPWVTGIAVPDRVVADVGVVWDGPRTWVQGRVERADGSRAVEARIALRCDLPKVTWLESGGFFDPAAGHVRSQALLATTKAGRAGRYDFSEVPPGIHSLCVLAEGCEAHHHRMVAGAGYQAVQLALRNGVRGTVHDVDGSPVAGALVAWTESLTDWRMDDVGVLDRVLTDADGRFDLHPPTPIRSWNVLVRPADGPPTLLPLGGDQASPQAIVLPPFEEIEVLVLRDDDGAPLPNARFALYCDLHPGSGDRAASVGSGYTDGQGRARVPMPGGDVGAALVHHPECGTRIWDQGQRPTRAALAAPKVSRVTSRLRQVELRMPLGRAITGTVVDAAGEPLANVWVRAVGGFRQVVGGAITDERGAFLLHAGLDAQGHGSIYLQAERRGWEQITDLDPIELRWPSGPDVVDRRLVLRRAGSFVGRVVDGQGAPVARALVTARDLEGEGGLLLSPHEQIELPRPTLTADDGSYELRGPFPPRTVLTVHRTGRGGADVLADAPPPGFRARVDVQLR